jgi:hypothetical protein
MVFGLPPCEYYCAFEASGKKDIVKALKVIK